MICYCNPQMGADGTFHHAINCPLRNSTEVRVIGTPVDVADGRSEWQKGYDAGYAQGLASARRQRGPLG